MFIEVDNIRSQTYFEKEVMHISHALNKVISAKRAEEYVLIIPFAYRLRFRMMSHGISCSLALRLLTALNLRTSYTPHILQLMYAFWFFANSFIIFASPKNETMRRSL